MNIPQTSLSDFRAWLSEAVPTLQITRIRKYYDRTEKGPVFIVKFWDTPQAASFAEKYSLYIIDGFPLKLTYCTHVFFMDIDKDMVSDEWDIRENKALHPRVEDELRGSSMLRRLDVPLASRVAGPSTPAPRQSSYRKGKPTTRRAGKGRKEMKDMFGPPV